MEKSVSSDSNACVTVLDAPIKDYEMENAVPSTPVGSTCKEVMTKKEGDQTTIMENQNVMEKSVSSDSNASGTVLDRPIKDYVMEKPEPSILDNSSTCKEVMTEQEGDQTTIMENQNVMEKSVSSDSNTSGTLLDRPIKDYVTEKPEPSTPEASTCKEVKKESRKTDCNKKGSSLQINLKNFYQVDGILLKNECGENYPRILTKKERDKKSLEDFKREPQTKTKDRVLSSRQVCENTGLQFLASGLLISHEIWWISHEICHISKYELLCDDQV